MIEHKPLIEYLPEFLAEYREYKRYFEALQAEDDSLLTLIDRALQDTFISEVDLDGIRRWEKMLGIIPNVEETLEDRRANIQFRMSGRRPFTLRMLSRILDTMLGAGEYTSEMTGPFDLRVRVALTSKYQLGAVNTLIRKLVPANVRLVVELMYHQQQEYNGIYTHAEMASYTHAALKEGV